VRSGETITEPDAEEGKMIQRMSHATLYVLDQDSAKEFYVNKLGFEVRTDHIMEGGFRWLTVGPKGQPDLEIILMAVAPGPSMTEETVAQLRELVRRGAMGAAVFATGDCQRTYEELSARGVEFLQPPTERFYGIEALFEDDSGNWFSLTERKM
jgi:catechol 2,3-dioxygenase-like lactoylglutathione lyase family enzyme